jgi:DNA-binding NarL/FixJ family response regulator
MLRSNTSQLPLTERQREYLRLAMHGYTDRHIAAGCGVSFSSVRRELLCAYRNLGVLASGNIRTAAAVLLYQEEYGTVRHTRQ